MKKILLILILFLFGTTAYAQFSGGGIEGGTLWFLNSNDDLEPVDSTWPLYISSTATSTYSGGIQTSRGLDGKFLTAQQILLGSGSATTTYLNGTGTSTFAGGVSTAGLSSSNGLIVSGGLGRSVNFVTGDTNSDPDVAINGSVYRAVSSSHFDNDVSDAIELNLHRHTELSGNGAQLTCTRSRGDELLEVAVASGDSVCRFTFLGHDQTDYEKGASLEALVDGTVSANTVPTRLVFSTTQTNSPTARLTIKANGLVQVNTTGTTTELYGTLTKGGLDASEYVKTTLGKFSTILATSTATSTFAGGVQTAGLSTSNGLTITGGSISGGAGGTISIATGNATFSTDITVNGTANINELQLTGNPLAIAYGGTNLTALAQGDIIYGADISNYARLGKNTTATRYLSNTGTNNNPAWAQVDLTNGVTGVLPVANGGTNGLLPQANGGTNATSYGANRVVFQNSGNTAFSSDSSFTYTDTTNQLMITQTGTNYPLVIRGNGDGGTDTSGEIMLQNTSGTPRAFFSNNDGVGGVSGLLGVVGTSDGVTGNERLGDLAFFETAVVASQVAGLTVDTPQTADGTIGMHYVTWNGASTRFNVWLDGNGGTALGAYSDYNQTRPPSNGLTVSGNVGIGDDAPAALLTVGSSDAFQVNSSGRVLANVGASGAGNLSYSFVNDTNTGLYRASADQIRFQTNAVDRLTLDSVGSLGIGTTSPFAKLAVATTSTTGTGNLLLIASSTTGSDTKTAFIVTGMGKVGIGTTSPSAQLAVQGEALINGTTTSNGVNINGGCYAINGVCASQYVLQASHITAMSPLDAATAYWGGFNVNGITTTSGDRRLYIPKTGTIKAIYIFILTGGTLGTTETTTYSIRLNDTTDTTISSTVAYDVRNQVVSNAALNIPVVAGDYIEIKMAHPTWTTNPTTISQSASIYIE